MAGFEPPNNWWLGCDKSQALEDLKVFFTTAMSDIGDRKQATEACQQERKAGITGGRRVGGERLISKA